MVLLTRDFDALHDQTVDIESLCSLIFATGHMSGFLHTSVIVSGIAGWSTLLQTSE